MVQNQPLVSVIVPVYNVELYIEDCLESIIKQNYQMLQIIIVDDGSTDTSNQKVKPFLLDSRVQLIQQENKGLSSARNTGLEAANGKYVLFVDSDDYIELTTVKELVELMEEKQVDLIRFNGKAFLDGLNKSIKQNNYDFSQRLQEGKKYTQDRFKANRKTLASPVYLYMVKREVLVKNTFSFYEGILHEDELFTTQVFLNSKSMCYVNIFYYNRRYRENSIMTNQSQKRLQQTFNSYLVIYKELRNLYLKSEYSKEQKKLIKREMISIYSGLITSSIKKSEKKQGLKKIKGINLMDKVYIYIKKVINIVK